MKTKNSMLNCLLIAAVLLISLYWGSITSVTTASKGPLEYTQRILYVRPGGSGDCSSWANACELQPALNEANAGDEIWAAEGVYYPVPQWSGVVTDTFQLVSGVALYGGFPNAEDPAWEERDWESYPSVLSGDFGTPYYDGDNSYHVVTSQGLTETAVLDGFTITWGYAFGDYPHNAGGGIYIQDSSLSLTRMIFSGNSAYDAGGGIFNQGTLTITLSTLQENESSNIGGGMLNAGEALIITSTIRDNQITYGGEEQRGGGIYNQGILILSGSTILNNYSPNTGGIENTGILTVTNATVSGNTAGLVGGIHSDGHATLNNVTLSDNAAWDDGSAGGVAGNATLRNSILTNNRGGNCLGAITSAGYNLDSEDSCNFDQVGDLTNANALLSSLSDFGGPTLTYALLPASPAIDAGSCTDSQGNLILTDQRGTSRPQGLNCDIGSFEGHAYVSFVPDVPKFSFVELTVTSVGSSGGYPTYYRVYGHVTPIVSLPVYSVSIGIDVTYYPEEDTPWEATEIRYPAFPVSLPGQSNPFSWGAMLGHTSVSIDFVHLASESLTGDQSISYHVLTILDWYLEENSLLGVVRNDSGKDLENLRVVIFSDNCSWKEATLTITELLQGEETDFRLDSYYCSDEVINVVGQGSSSP